MKNYLLNYAALVEIPIENWGISEIMSSWVALEKQESRTLKPNGWGKKMKDIKAALDLLNIKIMDKYDKEIKFLTQEYIKMKIDTNDEPPEKKSANHQPRYCRC